MITPFNSDDPMMKSHSNYEMDKLNSWKKEPLIEEEYFNKLRICILQRIQLNQDFQGITMPLNNLPKTDKNLNKYWIYTSGIAALFLIAFSCYQIFTSSNNVPFAQQGIRKTSMAYKTLQIDSTNSDSTNKITVAPIEHIQKDSIPIKQQFETALESLTDEDLEAINWELYFDESF